MVIMVEEDPDLLQYMALAVEEAPVQQVLPVHLLSQAMAVMEDNMIFLVQILITQVAADLLVVPQVPPLVVRPV
jgi:hypothetical protein